MSDEPIKRGPGRPPNPRPAIRADLPRSWYEGREQRARKSSLNYDQFYVDPSLIPDDVSLNWKAHTVMGAEQTSQMMRDAEAGWEPVTADMIPGIMPDGYRGPVMRDGQMLMHRPKHFTEEAEREAYREAKLAVQSQKERAGMAPPGHFSRSHPELRSGIQITTTRGEEGMDIPA